MTPRVLRSGVASVLLHPDATIAIGRTAASRRYREYGCMWKKALEALRGAEGAARDGAHIRGRAPEWARNLAGGAWWYY